MGQFSTWFSNAGRPAAFLAAHAASAPWVLHSLEQPQVLHQLLLVHRGIAAHGEAAPAKPRRLRGGARKARVGDKLLVKSGHVQVGCPMSWEYARSVPKSIPSMAGAFRSQLSFLPSCKQESGQPASVPSDDSWERKCRHCKKNVPFQPGFGLRISNPPGSEHWIQPPLGQLAQTWAVSGSPK